MDKLPNQPKNNFTNDIPLMSQTEKLHNLIVLLGPTFMDKFISENDNDNHGIRQRFKAPIVRSNSSVLKNLFTSQKEVFTQLTTHLEKISHNLSVNTTTITDDRYQEYSNLSKSFSSHLDTFKSAASVILKDLEEFKKRQFSQNLWKKP